MRVLTRRVFTLTFIPLFHTLVVNFGTNINRIVGLGSQVLKVFVLICVYIVGRTGL